MAKKGTTILDGADAVLDNHSVLRDGSYWLCRFCKQQWPWPSPLPDDAGPCVPRRWGDGEPEPQVIHAQASELNWACPRCEAPAGRRCRDLRRVWDVELLVSHPERCALAKRS